MIKEYYLLIIENIKNYKAIFYGFKNSIIFLFLLNKTKELILNRRAVCRDCLFLSLEAQKHGYKTKRFDTHCSICKCNKMAKTASIKEKCLINMW